ncbi:unnamed protein product, partial [marine sediment metagenome]
TTAAVAYQLGRNYVGVEISQKYVENTEKRLAELKDQQFSNLFLNTAELNELKRLLSDIKKPAKEIAADKSLLRLFTDQFAVRMNNQKCYRTAEIVAALGDIAD